MASSAVHSADSAPGAGTAAMATGVTGGRRVAAMPRTVPTVATASTSAVMIRARGGPSGCASEGESWVGSSAVSSATSSPRCRGRGS